MVNAADMVSGGRYCRGCGYDRRGQPHDSPRCPECGRDFDPADPATYRARPPGLTLRKWTRRSAAALLVLGVLLGSAGGWLYWGWKSEQAAVARLGARVWRTEPLGGALVQRWLGPAGWVVLRATWVDLPATTTDAGLAEIAALTRLQYLNLDGAAVTDAGLVHLRGLRLLRYLYLDGTAVMGAGLVHLRALPDLDALSLSGTAVTDPGLAGLPSLPGLRRLWLDGTKLTDAGLAHLRGLPRLERLDLSRTKVGDAGLADLKALTGLEVLDLTRTGITPAGMAELRQAPPKTTIHGP